MYIPITWTKQKLDYFTPNPNSNICLIAKKGEHELFSWKQKKNNDIDIYLVPIIQNLE